MKKVLSSLRKIAIFLTRNNVIVLIIALTIISVLLSKGIFIRPSNLINIFLRASIVGIIVIGQTLVITTGGIDLSVGSNLSWILVVMTLFLNKGYSVGLTILVGIATGLVTGLVNGTIISRTKIPPFIVTLGMMMILQSLALVFGGESLVYVVPIRDVVQKMFEASEILKRIFPLLIYLLFLSLGYYFQRYTKYGYEIYAVGANETCSIYSGLKTRNIKMMVYMISGAMCGVAAILFAYRIAAAHPQVGKAYLIDSIAAPIIGGVDLLGGQGSILGAFGGTILIAIISNLMVITGVSPFIEEAVKGVIILAYIIIIQPTNTMYIMNILLQNKVKKIEKRGKN